MPKILLVEDNLAIREMLADRLQRKQYEVIQVNNGREALAQVNAVNPALILMDVSMPEMDGLEATQRLKADPALRHIPVIILTAHAYAEDRAKAQAAGCDDYLPKPVDFAALHRKIQALLAPPEAHI